MSADDIRVRILKQLRDGRVLPIVDLTTEAGTRVLQWEDDAGAEQLVIEVAVKALNREGLVMRDRETNTIVIPMLAESIFFPAGKRRGAVSQATRPRRSQSQWPVPIDEDATP